MQSYDHFTADRQIARERSVRRKCGNKKTVMSAGYILSRRQDNTQNIMQANMDLGSEGAAMGDIVERPQTVWGTYRETLVLRRQSLVVYSNFSLSQSIIWLDLQNIED